MVLSLGQVPPLELLVQGRYFPDQGIPLGQVPIELVVACASRGDRSPRNFKSAQQQ